MQIESGKKGNNGIVVELNRMWSEAAADQNAKKAADISQLMGAVHHGDLLNTALYSPLLVVAVFRTLVRIF